MLKQDVVNKYPCTTMAQTVQQYILERPATYIYPYIIVLNSQRGILDLIVYTDLLP